MCCKMQNRLSFFSIERETVFFNLFSSEDYPVAAESKTCAEIFLQNLSFLVGLKINYSKDRDGASLALGS